jgi:hypothetical protein
MQRRVSLTFGTKSHVRATYARTRADRASRTRSSHASAPPSPLRNVHQCATTRHGHRHPPQRTARWDGE